MRSAAPHSTLDSESQVAMAAELVTDQELQAAEAKLVELKKDARVPLLEKLSRSTVAFWSGFAGASTVIGITSMFIVTAISFWLTWGVALVLGGIIARYLYQSYLDQDQELANNIVEYELALTHAKAARATEQSCQLYLDKLKKLNAYSEIAFGKNSQPYNTTSKNYSLINGAVENARITKPLVYLLQKADTAPKTKEIIEKIHVGKKDESFMSKVLHKPWAPALTFFAVMPTIFGNYKMVFAMLGIAAVAGLSIGTLGFGLAALAITSAIGISVGIIHQLVLKRNEKRKDAAHKFSDNNLKTIKRKIFKLEEVHNDLSLVYRAKKDIYQSVQKSRRERKKILSVKPALNAIPLQPMANSPYRFINSKLTAAAHNNSTIEPVKPSKRAHAGA
jgi:hypothetical protein